MPFVMPLIAQGQKVFIEEEPKVAAVGAGLISVSQVAVWYWISVVVLPMLRLFL